MARTSDVSARNALVRDILTSRQFAHADSLKRIFRYLVERSADSTGFPPKEYEIAVEAMGRPATFDPRIDPIVRVSLSSIRERLLAYFATEGRNAPVRLEIPRGHYQVQFVETEIDEEAVAQRGAALSRFWQPYLESSAPNVIVYTEPLFFRDSQKRYFRDWSVNQFEGGVEKISHSFPGIKAHEITPVFHYLSAGEVHSLLSLTRMFHEARVPVETRNSRISQWQELSRCNLILLGSPRTNVFLEKLQDEYPLVTLADRIECRGSGKGRVKTYRCRRFLDGSLQRMTEYAVVTRRHGVLPGCCITMIAANHGRAIEAAGHLLTLEDRVQLLLDRMQVSAESTVPQVFQLLVRVETVDVDDEVTSVEIEAIYTVEP